MKPFAAATATCLLALMLALTPAHSQSALRQADSLYLAGNFRQAISLYRNYLGDTSTNTQAWQRLADACRRRGLLQESLAAYRRAFAQQPSGSLPYGMFPPILDVFDRLGRGSEAISFLEPFVQQGYGNYVLIRKFAMFRSLADSPRYQALIGRARANAYPCLADPHHHEMDFWIGDWDVYPRGSNQRVGSSHISREDGGCVILENFRSLVSPQSGHSINLYDAGDSCWIQLYAGSLGGHQLYTGGRYRDSAMVFQYRTSAGGRTGQGRYILYDQGPDQFRQYQDISYDGGNTYTVNYDFIYRRKREGPLGKRTHTAVAGGRPEGAGGKK
ncbi:MAG TPA: tetratricopeptide repeat protein [Chitinophagaceae bacterium]|nr:tetratricopeptide repeat protein [Chitinophagaceae bacterium]